MAGHRLSTRLDGYDYRFGAFFISLVAQNRERLFGEIINGKEVRLFPPGQILLKEWLRTPIVRSSVQLDEWIIMPDHFQAIVIIDNGNHGGHDNNNGNDNGNPNGNVGGASWRPCQYGQSNGDPIQDSTIRIQSIQPASRSLARMINQFKSTTTRRINEIRGTPGQPVWQRGYHDRIIRNDVELDRVRVYIKTNPERG